MAKHRSHMRSLQRALHKDDAGRRITAPIVGPLFASETADGDQTSGINGTIYVLRSKSDHPVVAANRDLLHEIGVTGGDWHGGQFPVDFVANRPAIYI